jgi:hypothetical protein
VQHLSFWLDLKILAATILTLGGKAKSVPSSWLVSSRPASTEAANSRQVQQTTASSVLGWRTDVEAIDDRADRGLVA